MTAIEPGDVVGPVRLAKLLRKDSTHVLYEGKHVRLGVDVALRLMPRSSPSDSFLRDARLAADARHPALVPVIDFGEYGDVRYVVMARAHGKTLEQHMAEHDASLPERVVLRVLWRVAEVLEILHDAGLAHGRLRPSSLVMDARGQLRVTDLEFAAEGPVGRDDQRSLYGPPETGLGEAAPREDSRALDLFALGVIAYEGIFRRMPYPARTGADVLSGASIEPASFDGRAGYSPALLSVIERLIAVDPRQRIQSAPELLKLLPPPPEPPRPAPRPAQPALAPAPAPTQAQAPAHDSELLSILEFLQRRFGSRKTQQAEGAVVHSSLRERVIVWLLLILLLTGTVLALLPD
jgi:eukaryotic-like serine/threonine-protein kinase